MTDTTILGALNSLTDAITELGGTASAAMTALQSAINDLAAAQRSTARCGDCPVGEITDPGLAEEGGTPPPGHEEWPAETYDLEKCKLANMTYDDLHKVISQLASYNLVNWLEAGVAIVSSTIGAVLATLATGPLGIGLAVLGVVAGVISVLLLETIDLDELLSILETQHQAIVQGLYNSASNVEAAAVVYDLLDAGGADFSQLNFIEALALAKGLVVMFYQRSDDIGAALAARLDGYPVTIECVSTSTCEILFCEDVEGTMGSGDLSYGTGRVLSSAAMYGYHYIAFRVGVGNTIWTAADCDTIEEGCDKRFFLTITATSSPGNALYGTRCIDAYPFILTEWSNSTVPHAIGLASWVKVIRSAPFTITVDLAPQV